MLTKLVEATTKTLTSKLTEIETKLVDKIKALDVRMNDMEASNRLGNIPLDATLKDMETDLKSISNKIQNDSDDDDLDKFEKERLC